MPGRGLIQGKHMVALQFSLRRIGLPLVLAPVLALLLAGAAAAQVARFVGDYAGSAEVEIWDGSTARRDMSVSITETRDGFNVKWSSTTYRGDKGKEKAYSVNFVPTDRDSVFAAAMARDVFGHEKPLDPMKGEPYVWARIKGDTLSVYSLFVADDGSFELQQFDRIRRRMVYR